MCMYVAHGNMFMVNKRDLQKKQLDHVTGVEGNCDGCFCNLFKATFSVRCNIFLNFSQ